MHPHSFLPLVPAPFSRTPNCSPHLLASCLQEMFHALGKLHSCAQFASAVADAAAMGLAEEVEIQSVLAGNVRTNTSIAVEAQNLLQWLLMRPFARFQDYVEVFRSLAHAAPHLTRDERGALLQGADDWWALVKVRLCASAWSCFWVFVHCLLVDCRLWGVCSSLLMLQQQQS